MPNGTINGVVARWRRGGTTPSGLKIARTLTQGSLADSATLICSLYMIYLRSSVLRQSLSSTAPWECFSLRRSTEASVASRSGTAQREAAAKPSLRQSRHPLRVCPHLVTALLSISCFSCAGKKMRPAPLRKGQSAACASSCNPWTAFGQSVAQPEPRTPMLRTRTVAGAAAQPVSSYK